MNLRRTISLAINLVGARFGGAAISLVSQIVLARLMPQSDVGIVFMGMSLAAFLSLVVTGGYPQLAITCLPRYYSLGTQKAMDAFHYAFWVDSLWMASVAAVLATLSYYFLPISEGVRTAILFGCLSAPPSALIRMNSAIANTVRRYSLSYVPDFLYRPGLLLLYLLTAWAFGLTLTTTDVLTVFVLSNTIIALGQAWALGRVGTIRGLINPVRHKLAPILRGRAMSLVLVGAVATAFTDIVTMTSGFFLPPDDVAVVGVTIRLAGLAGFITQAAQQFVLPDLTDAMTRGTKQDVNRLLLRINTISLVAMIGCIGGALLLGPFALRIYGSEYVPGHWPLVVFMVGQAFRAASGMNQHLLSLAGYQLNTAGACLIALVFLVATTSVLTPVLGIMGIATAVVVAEAVWAIMLASQAKRLTGRRGDLLAVWSASRS